MKRVCGAPQSLLLHDKNQKNWVFLTSVVYTFWNTRDATLSVFVFISTQMNVYTNVGSRTSSTTTSSIWSSNPTISSRHILFWIRINSRYCVLLYLLWNLCNNHPFLGDVILPVSFLVALSKKKLKKVFRAGGVTCSVQTWEMLSDRYNSHDFHRLEMCTWSAQNINSIRKSDRY